MTQEDYSLDEGIFLVKTARHTVESLLKESGRAPSRDVPRRFEEKRGAFVTIRTYPGSDLRGCIGRPYPTDRKPHRACRGDADRRAADQRGIG